MPDGVYSACRDIAVITRVHKDEAATFFLLKLFFPAEILKCAVSELLVRTGDTDCSPWSRMDPVAHQLRLLLPHRPVKKGAVHQNVS